MLSYGLGLGINKNSVMNVSIFNDPKKKGRDYKRGIRERIFW